MNVECQTIRVPTGVQDYRPALYGGIAAIELRRRRHPARRARRRSARARAPHRPRLHRRAAQLGHEQLGDHQAPPRRRSRTSSTASSASATRRSRCARRSSAATGTRSAARSPSSGTTASGSRPGVTTPAIDDLIAARRGRGRDGRQGLRRRRRRLPVLLRPAGARGRRSPRRSPTAARACSTITSRRKASALDNAAIARILREIADLLEIKNDNPFKIRAYRNGADIVANHPHALALLDDAGLREIPGIGKDLAARIREIADDRRRRVSPRAARRVSADACSTCCICRASVRRPSRRSIASSASARSTISSAPPPTAGSARFAAWARRRKR